MTRADAPQPSDLIALRATLLKDLTTALDAADERLFTRGDVDVESAALGVDRSAFDRLRAALASIRAAAVRAAGCGDASP